MTACQNSSRFWSHLRPVAKQWPVAAILATSLACSPATGQSREERLARTALDLLIQVDRAAFPARDVAKLNIETAILKLLPKGECPGLLRARFSRDTEKIVLSTNASQAGLLESETKLAAMKLVAQGAKPGVSDFDQGQPLREIAEKLVQAELIRNSATHQKLIDAQVSAELASDMCRTDAHARAEVAGESLENDFLLQLV